MRHRTAIASLIALTLAGPVYAQVTQEQTPPVDTYVPTSGNYQLPIPITLADGPAATPRREPLDPISPKVDLTEKQSVVHDRPQTTTKANPLLLPPRRSAENVESTVSTRGASPYSDPVRMLSSLAVVLGLFFAFIRLVRRHRVPSDDEEQLFDTVGRVSLLGKRAHIVRFGSKLLVLAKTSNGLEKLTELSNPEEVERVVSLCRDGSSVQLNRGLRDLVSRKSLTGAA